MGSTLDMRSMVVWSHPRVLGGLAAAEQVTQRRRCQDLLPCGQSPTTLSEDRLPAWSHHNQAADSFLTLSLRRPCSACHKSYCAWWRIQLSGEVSKATERRMAISGLIPDRPFSRLDNVLRLTPRAWAASVTLRPNGSRQSVRSISPGWGGLCIRIVSPQW